jgi:hypothetical protein
MPTKAAALFELACYLLDTSARQKVNFSTGRRSSTQTQPFRLMCHMYLHCTVNMAGCLKTQQNSVFSTTWELKLVNKTKTSPMHSQWPNN